MATRGDVVTRRRRATWREVCAGALVVCVPLLLDRVVPLHAPPHVGAFWGIIGLVIGAVGHFLHAFGGATLAIILRAWELLRAGFVELGRAVKSGLWDAGRATAKLLRSTRALWDRVLKPALSWANDKLLRLERWLHDTFAPVLRWLAEVKARLDAFYRTFIRPIVDTIEFMRALNRALEVFHIHALSKLDDWLAELEERIERPFLWVRSHITAPVNVIDRSVTVDGFLQRLTLLRSMDRYAPSWIHSFWTKQVRPVAIGSGAGQQLQEYPTHEVLEDVNALVDYWRDGSGDHAGVISELRQITLQAAQVRPDR